MKKNTIYSLLVIGATCLMTSCSQDSSNLLPNETKIMIDLGTDLSFNTNGQNANKLTRSFDESEYTNIKNYTVTLTKVQNEEVIHTAIYSDWQLAYEIEPGTEYTLSASYGTKTPASYDQLLVYGSETFTVQSGSTKKISFQCKPQAAKVNVVYSDDFSNYFSDCIVSIKTKHMDTPWLMSKSDEGKDLFIQTDENENVELSFDVKDLNGESVSPEGFSGTKTITITPQTLLKLTIKPDVTEIEGGKFGINISINTDVTDENVNIVLPNDIFNNN